MRQLFKLKIRGKIVLGFTIVNILMALIGSIAFFSLSTINDGMESMYNNDLQSIRFLGDVRRDLLIIRGDVYRYISTDNSAEYKELEKDIVNCFKTIKESMIKFNETDFTDEEKEETRKFENYLSQYEKDITSAISLQNTGDKGLALIMIDNAGINRERAIIILDNLVNMSTEAAEKSESLSGETYQKTIVFMISLVIICLIVSISIAAIVSRSIRIPIAKTLNLAKNIAAGDLISRVVHKSSDEVGELILSLNETADSLQSVIREVLNSSGSVTSASQQLSAAMEETNASMQEIANGVAHIAENNESNTAAIQQISATISNISDKAITTADSSKLAVETGKEVKLSAEKGGELVLHVSDSIDAVRTASSEVSNIMFDLQKSAHEINQAVELITGISEQTNLLSLNAAIEAARAGEQGRGFAVVADEVRALAEQSKDATKRIEQMVKAIQTNCTKAREKTANSDKLISNSYTAASETSSYIMNIIDKINTIVVQISEIADTAVQQSLMTKEISSSIDSMAENIESQASSSQQISAITQQQAGSVEEVGATAEELAGMAVSLNNIVSKFKA